MKLLEAINKARKQKTTISSEKCATLKQSPYSLLHWLFHDDMHHTTKLKNFADFTKAEDWTLDKKKEEKK